MRADREDLPSIESDKPVDDPKEAMTRLVALATRIARFLRHPDASVPLTIALTGRWGSGKSSLMKLVRSELVPTKPAAERYPCIWFNAWHHQNENYLFASLMESIRTTLLRDLPVAGYIGFHFNLLKQRFLETVIKSTLFFAAIIVGLVTFFVMLFSFLQDGVEVSRYSRLLLAAIPTTWLTTTRWNPMKAFGVTPSSLVGSALRWTQFPRFRDRLSFRHQFGHAFGEVCYAFGGRRPIIIIDDLDRCRPSQVTEVLEAVNFLTSNGNCFVLLGLDEHQVKHAVGIHHRTIAGEMLKRRHSETCASGTRNRDQRHRTDHDSEYEARQEYAKDYLEKLINLRITVPLPDYDELASLRAQQHS